MIARMGSPGTSDWPRKVSIETRMMTGIEATIRRAM
jgi:hypothetical protein